MRSIFPKDFPGTAEKLVEAQINLHILKKALQSPTAATNLACFMEGLAITKLVLVENGLLNIKRKPSKGNATSKSSKKSKMSIDDADSHSLPTGFDFADIRAHKIFDETAPWLQIIADEWSLKL